MNQRELHRSPLRFGKWALCSECQVDRNTITVIWTDFIVRVPKLNFFVLVWFFMGYIISYLATLLKHLQFYNNIRHINIYSRIFNYRQTDSY